MHVLTVVTQVSTVQTCVVVPLTAERVVCERDGIRHQRQSIVNLVAAHTSVASNTRNGGIPSTFANGSGESSLYI